MKICGEENCDQVVRASGLCRNHYLKKWRAESYGTPKANTGRPRSDAPGYVAMHQRLHRERGKASSYTCNLCGGPATDWVYDGLDPDERYGTSNYRRQYTSAYSLKMDHYHPGCRKCHMGIDLIRRDNTVA